MFAAQSIVTGVVADVIQTVDVTVDTTPPVDSFLLDGIAHVAPFVFEGVIGADHEVSVAPEICIEGSRYRFQGWSDSGAATHVFTVPAAPTSLIAIGLFVGFLEVCGTEQRYPTKASKLGPT